MRIKRAQLSQLWSEIRWILLGLVWLAGLLLGYAGFFRFSSEHALSWSPGDILYRTLQLIILESGSVDRRGSWMLETARFLLPGLTVYSALSVLMHLFREQLHLWRLRDHVIVCGLGRKGGHLASELLRLGQRVVAIEREPEHTRAAELREEGALLLTGDATERDILASARLHRARYLICLLGGDRENLEVAFHAYQLTRGRRRGLLTCIIHLTSPGLLNFVKCSELSSEGEVPFQIETFHPYARAAQLLIRDDAAWQEGADPAAVPSHLLVIGLGRLGEHLVVQAAYAWHKHKRRDRLCITILDQEAAEKTAVLVQEHPQLAAVCEFNPLSVDLSLTHTLNDALNKATAPLPVQRVYICLGDPVLSLQVCWSLRQSPAYKTAPIRVRLDEGSGPWGLLEKSLTAEAHPDQVIPFDLYRRTCSAEVVVGGLHELLAQELHERYLTGIGASSTGVPWDQLSEEIKKDNRQQAERIHRLLTAAGYRVNPFQNWHAREYVFPAAEVEHMARMEHNLWLQTKQEAGYRWGAVRDEKERTHPDLVPWEDLPDEERKKNEAFICELPSLLARLGFQIDRAEDVKEMS
ncbi:MAG: NAD-binding protein [Anaerolineae bacterium]